MKEGIAAEISEAVEIIKVSWRVFSSRLMTFLPIGFGFAAVNELANYFSATFKSVPVNVILFINLLITSWLTMLVLKLSLDILEGRKSSMQDLASDLMSKYPSFIAVTLLTAALIVLGLFCFILPGVYLLTIFYFADILVMQGEKNMMNAIKESVQLVKGIFRQVFLCISLVVCLLIIPLFAAQSLLETQPLISKGIFVFVSVLLVPFTSFVKTMIYKEMKEIKKDILED